MNLWTRRPRGPLDDLDHGSLPLVLFGGVLCIFSGISLGTVIATGLATMWPHMLALLVFTLVLVTLSVWRFRKQLS